MTEASESWRFLGDKGDAASRSEGLMGLMDIWGVSVCRVVLSVLCWLALAPVGGLDTRQLAQKAVWGIGGGGDFAAQP